MVRPVPREARVRHVAVQPICDELLRRGLEKSRKDAAALFGVVLVRHHDLELVLARLLDLLGQPGPLVRPCLLVEVEQHVGRVVGLLGSGDGETGEGFGELVGQILCARVGTRDPDRHLFAKVERRDPRLARDAEREGDLVHVGGRAEEQRLRHQCGVWGRCWFGRGCGLRRLCDDLERYALEVLGSHPDCVRPVPLKDDPLEGLGAIFAQLLHRPAALCRVRLLHEDDRLVHLERRANLPEAVLRRGGGGGG